jgi:hypothetical protein
MPEFHAHEVAQQAWKRRVLSREMGRSSPKRSTPHPSAIAMAPIRCRSARPRNSLTLLDDHAGEDIGLQHHQHADKAGEHDRVQKHITQDRAFMPEPVGCGRSHDDRLGVDHFAHHAARGVGYRH